MKRTRIKRAFPFEIRAVEESDSADGELRVEGYAAVFDQETDIAGLFREVVRPKAFRKTLKESDQVALWNHDTSKPLGRTSNKTLELKEDEHGLSMSLDMSDTTWGHDAHTAIKRGDVQGMSFGFEVIKEGWDEKDQLSPLRELKEIRLFEVSPVTFPAYAGTEVEARAELDASGIQSDATTSEPGSEDHSAIATEPDLEDHSDAGALRKERLRKVRMDRCEQNRSTSNGFGKNPRVS